MKKNTRFEKSTNRLVRLTDSLYAQIPAPKGRWIDSAISAKLEDLTIYEQLSKKVDLCRHAGDACMAKGTEDTAIIWYRHASKLQDWLNDMPVALAELRI